MNSGIVGRKLVVEKNGNKILKAINFNVKPGRLVGLIGPSGAGKTTMMRAIVGIQIPTSGSLAIDDLAAGSSELRGRIGYVPQSSSVYEDLTVYQNLAYFASLINASRAAIDTVIKHVDLTGQRNQVAATLSGGQRARVSLAIALLGEPDILVLDEPTVGLDPVLRHSLWQLFRRFAHSGKTILISSHVMDEADRCDDVILVRDGKLLWTEAREELLRHTKTRSTEAAFLKLVEAA
ncbi:TPA: multidrug ABC transporter ATP-binding protein [Candidatus Saccharibacteria bacterium]|nr:multidrug ABC transporter ATP-binding protein [Candidatus Saccharibacteria bacterium]